MVSHVLCEIEVLCWHIGKWSLRDLNNNTKYLLSTTLFQMPYLFCFRISTFLWSSLSIIPPLYYWRNRSKDWGLTIACKRYNLKWQVPTLLCHLIKFTPNSPAANQNLKLQGSSVHFLILHSSELMWRSWSFYGIGSLEEQGEHSAHVGAWTELWDSGREALQTTWVWEV